MPYSILQKAGRWCVVKKANGRVVACHDSKAKAEAQVAAIGASEHQKADGVALEVRTAGFASVRADVVPSSVKKEPDGSLVLRLRIASSYPVRRAGYLDGGFEEFEEVLSFEAGAHRAERLESGRAPLLACHREYDLSSVLGVLFDPSTTSTGGFEGFLECSARVSPRAELEGVRTDLLAGILTNVSIGYRVYQYRDVTERAPVLPGSPPPASRPLRRLLAIDWETREASILPVGADPTASVRSGQADEPHDVVLWSPSPESNMEPEALAPPGATATATPPAQSVAPAPTRAPSPAPAAQPFPASADHGAANELARQRSIREKLRRASLPVDGDLARALLDEPVPVPEATSRILDALATRDAGAPPTSPTIPPGGSEEDKTVRAIQDALEFRALRSQLPEAERKELQARLQGNPFVHHRLLRIGEEYLTRVHGMRDLARHDPLTLAGLVLDTRRNPATQTRGVPAFHVTSDFASVLANIANKALQGQFNLTPDTYSQWVNFGELPDFKQGKRVNLGDAPRLLRKLEGAEIVMGAVGEKGESVQLLTYARGLLISREAMVNDDLGAFTRFPRAFGSSSKQLVADLVYAVLTGNPALSDTFLLFDDTNHGNYVTGAGNSLAAAGVTALNNVRQRARRQKGITPGNNETAFFMLVDLPHLRVPETLETAAQQLTALIQAQTVGNVNPFQGAFRSVMAEPRLGAASALAFYLMADPAAVETVEVDFLQGESGPVIESRMSWSAEGVEMKCRLDVGVAAVEFRGLYKNDGTV